MTNHFVTPRSTTPETTLLAPLEVVSDFTPGGDQPTAIEMLTAGLKAGLQDQVLLGVTGSGKTFTIAHVIQNVQRPALILAPNKTLAAQLYSEMKAFFPHNAVEYFVSYYDYYQPEAYVPRNDLYIEKEASINDQLDRMRHAATRALLERRDAIIVASVSCIYGIGDVETYSQMTYPLAVGTHVAPQDVMRRLVELQYTRTPADLRRGTFRVKGDVLEIFPSHLEDRAWRLSFFGDDVESITEIDALTGKKLRSLELVMVYANSHYVTPKPTIQQAIKHIKIDLKEQVLKFEQEGKLLEAQRLQQRVTFDLEMMETTGMCAGIENYSRYLSGRAPGEAPPTLFEYLPKDAILVVDESHITIPQLGAMYKGDAVRKENLVTYGFRLPAARDNRPLKFEEWEHLRPQTIFVSATPGPWELDRTHGEVAEQVIRPTGLVDPVVDVRPTENQVDDLIYECRRVQSKGMRALVTTLTKKMAEALTEYLTQAGLKVRYLHSDVETLERIEIIRDLRKGIFDVLVGINLLREGLDIPECALVAILDADREGYLRSKTALIQTIGRAARNAEGKAILYADKMTRALEEALAETGRRRQKQIDFNTTHGIQPMSIQKSIEDPFGLFEKEEAALLAAHPDKAHLTREDLEKKRAVLTQNMLKAAEDLEFEKAAAFRDEIRMLDEMLVRFG